MDVATMNGRSGTRLRRVLAVGLVSLGALALAACGSDDTADGAGATAAGGDGVYPVTLTTQHGDVTIERAPERIVALDGATADEVLSLGGELTAVASDPDTFADVYPWLVDEVSDIVDGRLVPPSGEVNVEAVAATKPDLIIAQSWQMSDAALFRQLNDIAPVVIPESSDVNVDWDQRLLTTAKALGATDAANALIDEARASFSEVGATVPDIESKTYQLVRADPDGWGFGNGSVLELFGLTPAANQDNTQGGPSLSKERTSELDADVLGVWAPTPELRAALDDDPLFQALPAVKNGTVYYPDLALATAVNTPAPMALAWAKDRLAPTIQALK